MDNTKRKEISNGIAISGRLMKEANVDYQTFISLLGLVVSETRRSGQSISSGIKTIVSRLQRVNDIDSQELSKIVGAYRQLGIEVLKDADTFKNFGDIIAELSGKWDTLTDVEQKHIAFLTAGKQTSARFV